MLGRLLRAVSDALSARRPEPVEAPACEFLDFRSPGALDAVAAALERDGCVVLDHFVPEAEIISLRGELERYEQQSHEPPQPTT